MRKSKLDNKIYGFYVPRHTVNDGTVEREVKGQAYIVYDEDDWSCLRTWSFWKEVVVVVCENICKIVKVTLLSPIFWIILVMGLLIYWPN